MKKFIPILLLITAIYSGPLELKATLKENDNLYLLFPINSGHVNIINWNFNYGFNTEFSYYIDDHQYMLDKDKFSYVQDDNVAGIEYIDDNLSMFYFLYLYGLDPNIVILDELLELYPKRELSLHKETFVRLSGNVSDHDMIYQDGNKIILRNELYPHLSGYPGNIYFESEVLTDEPDTREITPGDLNSFGYTWDLIGENKRTFIRNSISQLDPPNAVPEPSTLSLIALCTIPFIIKKRKKLLNIKN